MEASLRAYLANLEARLVAGEAEGVEASLALLAGHELELDEDELRGARRRAVQLLAAGGDPLRGLDPEGRAVRALADDLNSSERRAAFAVGLSSLRRTADGLTAVAERLDGLAADEELAWRWLACALLAEELVD